jgi:hypothetical protein
MQTIPLKLNPRKNLRYLLDNDEAGVENDDSQSNSVETSQNKRSKQTPIEQIINKSKSVC